MAKSKIVFGGEVLIDLTNDNVTKDVLLAGYTAHGADGEIIEGANTFTVDASQATATEAEILVGRTAAKGNRLMTGTMPNNGAVAGYISTKDEQYTIAYGLHDGSGKVGISEAEKSKLIPGNIKQGVTILGVEGAHEGSAAVTVQAKEVTPTRSEQTVIPDDGYDYLSQVKVAAIPYVETDNAAGGITVTIG